MAGQPTPRTGRVPESLGAPDRSLGRAQRPGGVLIPHVQPPTIPAPLRTTVTDYQRPRMTEVAVSPSELWPVRDQMVTVTIQALAQDNSRAADWRVFAISCNKPHSADDLRFVDNNTVQLRASRSPDGEDRVYTVWVRAEDAAGNLSRSTPVHVTVPNDGSNSSG